jgi:hypothetical protein
MPGFEHASAETRQDVMAIRSGTDKPTSAFVAVRYRDHWFWIDNSDLKAKRAMTAIMFFFTLSDTGGNEKLPVGTIPAQ